MEKQTKTVSIVGGGIGGLASAILLAKQGYKVSLYEKNECLGGRASILHKDGYTFDMGPSRYLMPDIFEEFFESIDENIHDYLDLKQLSPSYRVFYSRDMDLSCPKTNENIVMSKAGTSLLLKKNVIILHGLHDDANTGRRKRLGDWCTSQGIPCFQPQCDHEHGLDLEKDIESIIKQVGIENLHEGTIIVGYSLGGVTAKHLINKIGIKVNKLITIASSFPRPPEGDDKGEEELLNYRNTVLDFELFNSLTNEHVAIFSKDDPVIPYEKAINYRSEYYPSSTILSYEGKGHFGKKRNVDSIPELLPFIVTNQIQITTYNGKICCNYVGLFGYNETEEKIRNGVLAVIKNAQTGKFLFQIKKKTYNIITLCGGGVEEGENYEETIIREIKEETGLIHPNIITKLGDSAYLRHRKGDRNLLGTNDFYYIEVDSDTTDSISPEEQDINGNIWLDENEVLQSISFYSHLIGWFRFLERRDGKKDYNKADKVFIEHCEKEGFEYGKGGLNFLDIYADSKRMSDIFESTEPGAGKQFLTFLDRAKIQYEIGMEFCKKNYDSIFDFFRRDIMRKGIKLNIRTTIDHYVARFFRNQLIRKIMQYTTVFLGTAPKQTPALYNIMSHCDFNMGVRYPKGGLHEIAKALHTIGLKYGVEYHLNTEIVGCEIKDNQIKSLKVKKKKIENIIILHGFTGHPTVIFIPWLKKKLESLGYHVEAPLLPNTDNPNILEQIEYVKNNCSINEHTIIVGHSLGSVVAQKIAESQKVKGLLLVGSYVDLDFIDGEGEDGVYAKTFDWNFDFKKIQSHCEWIDILHDKNDDTIGISQFEKIASKYGTGNIVTANDQHFCGDEEPEILKILMVHLGSPEKQREIKESNNFVISSLDTSRREEYKKIRIEATKNNPEAFSGDYDEIKSRDDNYRKSRLESKTNTVIFAYDSRENVIGTANYTIKGNTATIYGMYRVSEYRGKGIGSSLIQYIKNKCSGEGVAQITLRVYKSQDSAIKLYLKEGFIVISEGNDENGREYLEMKYSLQISLVSDIYLINADMAWFETSILPKESQTYPKSYRESKTFAPSGFIIYAGVNKKLPKLDHHNLYFCEDRDKNFGQIFDTKELPEDPSIYVSKITHTDPTMAPEGCENLFILVPIPNGIEISDNQKEQYKNMVRKIVEKMAGEDIVGHISSTSSSRSDSALESRGGAEKSKDLTQSTGLKSHVDVEEIFTISDFKSRYNSWKGTALGLAHPIMQTAVFRPNNISKKLDNLFYVGHNTNPGIGVPMVIISARLALERIMKKFRL